MTIDPKKPINLDSYHAESKRRCIVCREPFRPQIWIGGAGHGHYAGECSACCSTTCAERCPRCSEDARQRAAETDREAD